jgi:hypothetical protein
VLSTTPPGPVRASRSSTPLGREAATSTPCKDTEMPLTGRTRARLSRTLDRTCTAQIDADRTWAGGK